MKLRTTAKSVSAFKVNMGGIHLDQALPHRSIENVDPFLLIHHLDFNYKGGEKQSEVGVPPHPHKGFSPVSFIFKGGIHHRDSIGNDSLVMAGGTQWMHAGKGIIHSERPKKEIAEQGGDWELIQFWVNAPKVTKDKDPHYVALHEAETPTYNLPNNKGTIAVVAGEAFGIKGGVETESPQLLLRLNLAAGAEETIKIPTNYNALLYILNGEVAVNGATHKDKGFLVFGNDGEGVAIKANKETRAILLSGEPLNEPIESYGPFVMNTRQEIKEAIRAFQAGEMGTLNENFDDE